MNYFYTLLASVFIASSAFSQKVDYDNDSRWFWGLNAGATWSKTDVRYKTDLGYGLTIGRQFNYNYGKIFSFDIRARYLGGLWKGYGTDSTNVADNPIYQDYTSSGDPVILNYGTRVNELSLELAIHFNSLRERTGWDPYIFGGIGYTWYRTKGDLIGSDGFGYQYDPAKLNGGYTQNEVMQMTDKKFETNLNNPGLKSGFMPSLGIGIGYQAGKWFSLGIEHKTTFTLADDFDAHIAPSGKYANDWYHYTGAYLRFHIRSHYDGYTRVVDTVRQPNNNNLNDGGSTIVRPILPVVDFTTPNSKRITVSSPTYVLQGRIQHVTSSANVVFRHNGNYVSNFSFNPSTQDFQAVVNLELGQNVFELTGTNEHGSDNDQVIIDYVREDRNPPVVTYTNPATSPTTVQTNTFTLTGTVLNVTGRDKITMTVNGVTNNSFTYNASTKVFTAVLNLVAGSNVVTTTGVNDYGVDTKTTTIIYQPRITVQPPVVYFTNPSINPYTVNQNTFTLNADVLNVADINHVSFKQNGVVNGNFSFNPQTFKFVSNVVLIPGQNVFEIIGTNEAGSSSASTIIVYNYVSPKPPIVTITNPSSSPYETSSLSFNLNATVLNVTSKDQVKVQLNGANVTQFTYNVATNGVTATLTLNAGANYVTVTGTNQDGTDSKQVVLIYKRVETVVPPVVQFTNPDVNPFSTSTGTISVTASVLHVTNASGVNVNVNGANVTNFTFLNNVVTFPVNLIEGANAITITGTNTAGTASATQTIIYRKPITVQPPVVTFVDPIVNPKTSFNASYAVNARVRFVTGANQITLKINGQTSTNFTYVASSEMMDFNAGLVSGSNVIEITATNSAGSDTKSTVIVYKAPNPTLPPVVTITYPATNPAGVSEETSPVSATVLNVSNQSQIQVTVNNNPYSGFTYSTMSKVLTMNLNLVEGANTVKITATNSAGTADASTVINFKRREVLVPPTVTFTNPPVSGQTVSTETFTVKAVVTEVTQQSQLVLKHDGQIVNSSYWTFDPNTKQVAYQVTLNPGNNVFELQANTPGGAASASTFINYKKVEEVCDKPMITFTNPSNTGITVEAGNFTVKAKVIGITDVNQVELYLNGNLKSQGAFSASESVFTKELTLSEGSNLIEIRATNKCGTTTTSTVITVKPKEIPCIAPEITRLNPSTSSVVTDDETVVIKAQITNISAADQLAFTLDGTPVNYNFDQATQTLTAQVTLSEGAHSVKLFARNKCGNKEMTWSITRNVCKTPEISITKSSAVAGGSVTADQVDFSGVISQVQNQSDIVIKHNGSDIGFVFNAQTGVFSVSRNLVIGINTFTIKVSNKCGEANQELKFTRVEIPVVRPTILITNPAVTPFETSQAAQTIEVKTTGVTSASQVSITVNGVATNFNFNANGTIQFNATFVKGNNVIVATAVTSGGSASDTKTIIYKAAAVLPAPVITLTNPANCPAVLPNGQVTITGTVANVSSPSQVSITYNGQAVEFQSTLSNNVLTFSFVLNVNGRTLSFPLVITATNPSGSDTKTCLLTSSSIGNNGHGNNVDGVDESNPGKGGGGPNGGTKGEVDDENGKGGGTAPRGTDNGNTNTQPNRTNREVTPPSNNTRPTTTRPTTRP